MNFEDKDVYELIDGVLTDAIETQHNNDGSIENVCIHCGAYVDDYKYVDFESAKDAIKHDSNCAYLLALSMNTGRDYKKFRTKESLLHEKSCYDSYD